MPGPGPCAGFLLHNKDAYLSQLKQQLDSLYLRSGVHDDWALLSKQAWALRGDVEDTLMEFLSNRTQWIRSEMSQQ